MYFQTARLRAELEDRQRRRVVDEEFGASQRLGGRFEVAPLFGREPSQFEVVARYARLGHHQTHHELVRRHFEREEGDRLLVVDRHVARHGEREGRLTHRGAGGDDDQIRRLPAHRHAVERHEARRHAVEGALVLGVLLDLRQRARQHVGCRLHGTFHVSFGHLEDLLLGEADQVRHVGRFVVGTALNFRGRADQFALHVLLRHDFGVELDVGGRTDLLRELRQIGGAAHLFELLLDFEPLGDGVEVDRLQLRRQLLDGAVDQPVLLGVEGFGGDEFLYGDDRVLFEHQRTQHGLFQFDGLRRDVAAHFGQCGVGFAVACGRCRIVFL